MDAVTFITKLQKFIRDSYQNIGDAMISGKLTVWKNTSICKDRQMPTKQ